MTENKLNELNLKFNEFKNSENILNSIKELANYLQENPGESSDIFLYSNNSKKAISYKTNLLNSEILEKFDLKQKIEFSEKDFLGKKEIFENA